MMVTYKKKLYRYHKKTYEIFIDELEIEPKY